VEITTRTIQGRFLLRPSPALVAIIGGILARAVARYGIQIHLFTFISNHFHIIATIPDVAALSRFMCYVNGNTAREVGRLVDWEGRFWSRRYRSIEILDDDAQVERFKYVLSHGCKEGLVAHPRQWPGPNCVDALLEGTPVKGKWIDRTAMYYAGRRGKPVDEADFTEETRFELIPLPCWSHLSESDRRQRIEDMIEEIVQEAEENNRAKGRHPLGARAARAVNPHSHPDAPKKGNAPRCHTTCPEHWVDFVRRMRVFKAEYHAASTQFLAGKLDTPFPPNCFPPPLTYTLPRIAALAPT